MNKLMNNKESGITMIALIVTIIILLILAGISIGMATGNNGVLNKAGEAKERAEIAEIEEQLKLTEVELEETDTKTSSIESLEETIKEDFERRTGRSDIKTWIVKAKEGYITRIDIGSDYSYVLYGGKIETNDEFTSPNGTKHRKFEIYNAVNFPNSQYGRYKKCNEMIALLLPNHPMSAPYNWPFEAAFDGCTKLKSIKIPLAQSAGHYLFAGLPNIEYIELGSIGHAWTGAGYCMGFGSEYNGRNIGSSIGLTIEVYRDDYSPSARIFGWRTRSKISS